MTDRVDEQVDVGGDRVGLDPRAAGEAVASETAIEASIEPTLEEQLVGLQRELAASQDRYLRARADMENYKKRIERKHADEARFQKRDLLRKLLGVRDNLERALQFGGTTESNSESVVEGVRLTQYQLDGILQQEGVEQLKIEGEPFDPQYAEAIQSVDDRAVPDHTVLQVVRNGYSMGDEVLRPAQVVVSVHSDD